MCVCVCLCDEPREGAETMWKKRYWSDYIANETIFYLRFLFCVASRVFHSSRWFFFPVLSFLIRPIHFRAHELCFIFVDGFMEMTLFDISSANRQHASQQRKHGTHSHFPSLYSVLRYSFFLFHSLLLSKAKRQLNIDSILINQFFDVAFHLFPGKNLDEKETNAKTAHQTHLRTMHGQSKNKTRTK